MSATAIKRRKGTTAEHSAFTGLAAELTVDTTKNTVVVHDGATAGGYPLVTENTTQTISGTKTFSANPVLSGGTSNGVLYLSGTTVTSGSALTFDGTTLTITNGSTGTIQTPFQGTLLHLAGQTSGGTGRRFLIDAYSGNGPVIMGRQSNGTSSSPSATVLNNALFFIDAMGSADYSGTVQFSSSFTGYMRFVAQENFTSTAQGTYIDWGVTPIGSTAYASKMQLYSTGLVIDGSVTAAEFVNSTDTKYAKLLPSTAYGKKIVVFGSSVALGAGATNDQGWAYMLGQYLTGLGWTYTNASIGGNTTVNLINRFYTDLVPLQPDVVIIGLSLANEGILNPSGKQAVFEQYIDNIFQLVDMCRQQGFKVIVTGTYPNNSYTGVEYNYIKQADKFLQSSQIPYINFLGSVDNGFGQWRTGMYSDASHPNDIGHTAMYRAIPLSFFDRLSFVEENFNLNYPPANPIVMTGDTVTGDPIVYTVGAEPIGSWTMMMNMQMQPGFSTGVAYMTAYNGTASPLRLRAPTGVFDVATTGTIVTSTVSALTTASNHVAMAYDYYTDTLSLYVNGVFQGSAGTSGYGANPTQFAFLGRPDAASVNANGTQISNLAIYKVALNADQIAECSRGFYPKGSLQIFAPCADNVLSANANLLNLACSEAELTIKSSSISRSVSNNTYPISVTDTAFTVSPSSSSFVLNPSGTCTITLPSAVTYFGKQFVMKNISAFAVNSAASDVVPIAGGSAGTSILPATAGKFVVLQSDGTSWQIMQTN